jgi:conjugal transfer pilus assembly protein TrbC
MPRASLQRLTEQAARSGAVLVLRGLKSQSMRETLAAVQSLVADSAAAWQIDPQAFTRYDIHHAPTFVLPLAQASSSSACGTTCPVGEAHLRVSGDVTLDYALETMVRRHPEAASRADVFLKRLRALR